ncbi:MAG: LysR family transcriptional regulator [Pseudomonadota bacterium]|nr:LysR family transcriptional regulator [Pseudomonadota bacterium]
MKTRLELWQLEYFVAVAEELNFRQAADRLAITQPPLTRQVQALEALLGTRLLDRDRRGVALTDAGRKFLEEARALLAHAEKVLTRTRRTSANTQVVRLGITTVVDAELFTWLDKALVQHASGVRLQHRRQISQRSIADIRSGRLDAALIGLPSVTEDLVVETLFQETLVAALPASHALAKKRLVSLRDLSTSPFYWFERRRNTAYFDHFEVLFQKHGFAPQRLVEPEEHHVLLGLIAAGSGVALVPASLTNHARKGVIYRRLVEEAALRTDIAVTYAEGASFTALETLLDILRRHYQAAPSASTPVKLRKRTGA